MHQSRAILSSTEEAASYLTLSRGQSLGVLSKHQHVELELRAYRSRGSAGSAQSRRTLIADLGREWWNPPLGLAPQPSSVLVALFQPLHHVQLYQPNCVCGVGGEGATMQSHALVHDSLGIPFPQPHMT